MDLGVSRGQVRHQGSDVRRLGDIGAKKLPSGGHVEEETANIHDGSARHADLILSNDVAPPPLQSRGRRRFPRRACGA